VSQVIKVAFVGVCFAFEADGTVGPMAVPVFNKVEKIFHEVPEVETYPEQFPLLARVDALVVEQRGIDPTLVHRAIRFIAYEDGAEEVDGVIATKGNKAVEDYHFCLFCLAKIGIL